MDNNLELRTPYERRRDERGAALVTVLLISFLLLAGVTALLLEASMNTANVTDATSEEQAYYAAESGIQSVVDALRHGARPNPLIDPSKSPYPPDPNADPANKLTYFKAVRSATSNFPGDPSPDSRMSRWLPYDVSFPDRIILGDPATYSPINGLAYRVTVTDPDNISNSITYSTTGKIGEDVTAMPSKTWGDLINNVTITFVPKPLTVVDVTSGIANTDMGKFVITTAGTGGTIPTRERFSILVSYAQPQNTKRVIRGYIEPGTVTPTDVGNVRIFYDSQLYVTFGSMMTLLNGTLIEEKPGDPGAPSGPYGTYLAGYRVIPNQPNFPGETEVEATVTAPEPTRLLIRSTGFGPHGAQKQLETIIQKNYFSDLGAPSPLTLIGPPCTPVGTCMPNGVAPSFVFQPGSATGTIYSGKDVKLKAFLPPIGLTNDPNVMQVRNRLTAPPPNKYNGSVFGSVSNIADELPYWLQNPRNLDNTLQQLKLVAQASGKYYGPGVTPPTNPTGSENYGSFTNATGITYIDGPLTFSGEGGGILVVTGGLTFQGGFSFNGLVIVTGPGGILRTGGGSGSLQGNMVVAPYNDWGKTTCMNDPLVLNKLNCYLAPRYDISGGGSSEIVYNSNNVTNGLGALTNFVKGVAEK